MVASPSPSAFWYYNLDRGLCGSLGNSLGGLEMKYVAYIQIDNDDYLMNENRLAELLSQLLDEHYGHRLRTALAPVKLHVHVECPSKRWSTNAPDDY